MFLPSQDPGTQAKLQRRRWFGASCWNQRWNGGRSRGGNPIFSRIHHHNVCVLVDAKHDIKFGYLILVVPSMFLHIFILWLASFRCSPCFKHISAHSWDNPIDPAGHWSGRPAPQQWRRHPPRCPNAFRRWTSGGPTAGLTEATPPGEWMEKPMGQVVRWVVYVADRGWLGGSKNMRTQVWSAGGERLENPIVFVHISAPVTGRTIDVLKGQVDSHKPEWTG